MSVWPRRRSDVSCLSIMNYIVSQNTMTVKVLLYDHSLYNGHMQKLLVKKFGRAGYNLILVSAVFIICLVVGVLFYHNIEGLSPIDAVYFTTMTLTTVGYGDFSPHTDAGKLFTAVYAVIGVGVFLGLATSAFSILVHRLGRTATDKD